VTTGAPPPPLARPPIKTPFWTGVRVLDGLLTLGRGQRVGLFAGSGVGKSLLLGQIARGAEADVVVICLVGERGRELVSFMDEALGPQGLRRSVVVCATSDAPALARRQAPLVATAIAESFRDQGQEVLLLMDSVTRFARAQREVGLACGEPPVRRGYPPSVFSALPQLLERAGTSAAGSITAIYTALVEGDDMDDPIADELRGLLDGHIVLSRELAQRAWWPAVDPARSLSRLMRDLVSDEHLRAAQEARRALALAASKRDLIAMGAWRKGADRALDEALAVSAELEPWLQQRLDERSAWEDTLEGLLDVVG
jgi:FliI/YscN family ATPase